MLSFSLFNRWITPQLALVIWVSTACSSQPYFDSSKAHHTPSGFKNIYGSHNKGFWSFIKWRWDRFFIDVPAPESYNFPVQKPNLELINNSSHKVLVTWIGHATVLLQINGINVVTDPHFTERASPVTWAGPKRVVPPALKLEELPPIDAVVISHNHYDSLDLGTVEAWLQQPWGHQTKFMVPLGIGRWLKDRGVRQENIIELDWWQSAKIKDVEFTATPVQHWSKRTLWDTHKSLWAGFAIKHPKFNFFFAGDSGYCEHFKEIGEKLGPFDMAAIPIGAYEPRWFMKFNHMNPKEAVQAHRDIRTKKSIGMHWGTFILTDEPLDQPPKDLKIALVEAAISEQDFLVLQHGQVYQGELRD